MDLGSGIPDPGVKKAPDPGSRIRIRNTDRYRYLYLSLRPEETIVGEKGGPQHHLFRMCEFCIFCL
jgi:hypothetical protein